MYVSWSESGAWPSPPTSLPSQPRCLKRPPFPQNLPSPTLCPHPLDPAPETAGTSTPGMRRSVLVRNPGHKGLRPAYKELDSDSEDLDPNSEELDPVSGNPEPDPEDLNTVSEDVDPSYEDLEPVSEDLDPDVEAPGSISGTCH